MPIFILQHVLIIRRPRKNTDGAPILSLPPSLTAREPKKRCLLYGFILRQYSQIFILFPGPGSLTTNSKHPSPCSQKKQRRLPWRYPSVLYLRPAMQKKETSLRHAVTGNGKIGGLSPVTSCDPPLTEDFESATKTSYTAANVQLGSGSWFL